MKSIIVGWVAIIGALVPAGGGVFGIYLFWHDVAGVSAQDGNAFGATCVTVLALAFGSFLAYLLGENITYSAWYRRHELRAREAIARRKRELSR